LKLLKTLFEIGKSIRSKLDSRLDGGGFESHPMLDGKGVKAMPELIPAPNPGSLIKGNRKKI